MCAGVYLVRFYFRLDLILNEYIMDKYFITKI